MALGKRGGERQAELWTPTQALAGGPGHVFYDQLNQVLARAGFDRFVEELCEPFYARRGRPSVPPGVYFRMLMIGYLEGIDSQRGIAWRCEDSLSLRRFLGIPLSEQTPDHSSLTRIRNRLPLQVHQQVFQFILSIIAEHGLLRAQTVGVDSTLLEANAAMKSIVRKESGEDWKAYLKRLMQEEGLIDAEDDPSEEDLRKFDQSRHKQGKKKVSNEEWVSSTDPDARIAKLKDGRTHLGYKAEHVVALESEIILSATIHPGTDSDATTLVPNIVNAQCNVILAGSEEEIAEVATDKGYHKNDTLAECTRFGLRTYIPEPGSPHQRTWTDKPAEVQRAVVNNRRRMRREKGQALQHQRSEKVERSFAHVCETGGARRTWLRGLEKINKRYLIVTAARNLGLLMHKVFGIGKPRGLQAGLDGLWACLLVWIALLTALTRRRKDRRACGRCPRDRRPTDPTPPPPEPRHWAISAISTGCVTVHGLGIGLSVN